MKTYQADSMVTKFHSSDQHKQALHPAWIAFIRHCQEMGFGEISQLKVQDGIPVMAKGTTKKVKLV